MAYADTLQRTWRENILFSVLLELTYRCNLRCFFCYNDTALAGVPLARDEWFRLLDDLRGLGTLNLTLSGGEPLAHPEFFAIGRRARELGFLVRVKSNGHALHGELARRVRDEVDPFIVELSLHGASAATHDRQTRVPGSFERLAANLRAVQALGLRIKLNSALTAWNEHEVEAMFALADALGAPVQFDPQITRRDDGDPAPLSIAPSAEGIARLYRLQRERQVARDAAAAAVSAPCAAAPAAPSGAPAPPEGRDKHCGAGSSTLVVDPFGNVYPCVQWRRRIGNLHEDSIADLWRRSPELARVRRIAADVRDTVDGHATPGFAFCPGTAEQETGSATRLYPVAKVLLDLRRRIPVA